MMENDFYQLHLTCVFFLLIFIRADKDDQGNCYFVDICTLMLLSIQSSSFLSSILQIKYFASQYFITMCLNSDFSGMPSCDILRMNNSIVILELFISHV